MLAALVRWLISLFPWLSYDYRHRRVRKVQFCPACANKVRVQFRFSPGSGQVVCQCPECMACWGYNPIVKSEAWASLPKDPEVR